MKQNYTHDAIFHLDGTMSVEMTTAAMRKNMRTRARRIPWRVQRAWMMSAKMRQRQMLLGMRFAIADNRVTCPQVFKYDNGLLQEIKEGQQISGIPHCYCCRLSHVSVQKTV